MAKKADKLPKAVAVGELKIGTLLLPCAVLDDKENTRVLSARGFAKAIGASTPKSRDDELPGFLSAANLKPYLSAELRATTSTPLWYVRLDRQGGPVAGIPASLLPDVCEAWLKARDADALHHTQLHLATQADLLMRGLARVGIVALVDEATGYQAIRARNALEQILEAFIAKELHSWVKTFPDEYYVLIYKLNRWQGDPLKGDRPGIVGGWTNDIVYERLAPGVLAELQRLTPRGEDGRLTQKLHQRLTREVGHPKLKSHLDIVTALMRASTSWGEFIDLLNRSMPKTGVTIPLPLPRTRPEEDAT